MNKAELQMSDFGRDMLMRSPGAPLLTDEDLNGRQIIRELGGRNVRGVVRVAVHLRIGIPH